MIVRHRTAGLLWGLLLTSIAFFAGAGDYRPLEWSDLVPEGWKRPIILPAPPEDGDHHPVDPGSVIRQLDGESITLPGFMIPVKFEQNVVSEFLMVPFLEQHMQRHVHHEPNQMLYVYLDTPVAIHNPYAPLWVKGRLRVKSVETDEGPSGYVVEQALIEPYTYESDTGHGKQPALILQ